MERIMKDLIFMHARMGSERQDRVDKHYDGYHVLIYIPDGGVELFYDDEHCDIKNPTFFPAYPGRRIRYHSLDPAKPWKECFVAFRGELVEDWKSRGLWPFSPVAAPDNPAKREELSDLLIRLVKLSQSTSRLHKEQGKALLEYLVLRINELQAGSDESAWSRELKWKILGSVTAIDYDALAKEMMMSVDGMRRKFKSHSGQTMHDYWIDCRIGKARELLADRKLSIKKIANRLGYKDIYYFSRQFRSKTGIPPATYRKSSC
jgi:AraC-like DNA-binding protein